MRSIVLLAFFMGAFVAASLGATSRGNYSDPRYPGKCVLKGDVILSPGDKMKDPTKPCARVMCGQNGFAVFHTCGVRLVEGCKLGDYVDLSLPYPECCERHIICD